MGNYDFFEGMVPANNELFAGTATSKNSIFPCTIYPIFPTFPDSDVSISGNKG